ncbi:MAG: glycosyltransferase family 4 protein [Hyphomicrobium sp.]
MRILYISSLYPTPLHPKIVGGAERAARALAERMVEAGFEVEVIRGIAPDDEPTVETVNGVKVYGAPIHNIYWPFDGEKPNPLQRLAWHLKDDIGSAPDLVRERLGAFRPHIVHSHTLAGLTTEVWKLAKAHGARVVHTMHDYYLLCPRSTLYAHGRPRESISPLSRFLTRVRRARTRNVDAIVGVSGANLDLHRRHGLFTNVARSAVIGPSVIATPNPLPPRDRGSDKRLAFGYIGRMTEEKGVFDLARALSSLPQDRVVLRMAGNADASLRDELQSLAGMPIDFLGFVDPVKFFSDIDVTVVPSRWHEPAALAVTDSLLYGRPVLGARRGGIPEYMGTPPYGWTYDPADADALARTMQQILREGIPELSLPVLADNPAKYLALYNETDV